MNKKLFFNLFLGVMVAGMFLLSGCGKDDNTPDNAFTYDGTTYDLSHGLIMTDTIVPGQVYGHIIGLFSDGFTIHTHTEGNVTYLDSIKGKGEALIFWMFTDNATGPADGTYNHLPSDKSFTDVPDIFTWASGKIYIDYTEKDDGNDGEDYEMVGGTIQSKNTGTSQFEFKFNITGEDNKTMTGYSNIKLTGMIMDKKKSLNLHSLLR